MILNYNVDIIYTRLPECIPASASASSNTDDSVPSSLSATESSGVSSSFDFSLLDRWWFSLLAGVATLQGLSTDACLPGVFTNVLVLLANFVLWVLRINKLVNVVPLFCLILDSEELIFITLLDFESWFFEFERLSVSGFFFESSSSTSKHAMVLFKRLSFLLVSFRPVNRLWNLSIVLKDLVLSTFFLWSDPFVTWSPFGVSNIFVKDCTLPLDSGNESSTRFGFGKESLLLNVRVKITFGTVFEVFMGKVLLIYLSESELIVFGIFEGCLVSLSKDT